ncbi:hypothetical protein SDRG_16890 [Saprolegnia diclina VS20]|uniref:Uncharacterized protein n=1 Tax=Saprolegnia diclina (strain VS20) TaxID=1156394 RepID=T0PW29_SAPDV|nr:hypothetical protein SDRG_16890 [Saprolegnia diclina VS20]EQC25235.1 hypothetical protein SDRG_16890 [Saprolegnia diclina VS20]|eukprot:XP_008621336.1 hypothetical protein SDRG_16890 [Saprolegnia diclina VS20]
MKLAMDAIHTAHSTCASAILPPCLWLRHPSAFRHLVLGLRQPSLVTVAKCAHVVAQILTTATTATTVNALELLTQDTIATMHAAFWRSHDSYKASVLLESICMSLHMLEVQARRKLVGSLDTNGAPPLSLLGRVKACSAHLSSSVKSLVIRSKNSLQTRLSHDASGVDATEETTPPFSYGPIQPPTHCRPPPLLDAAPSLRRIKSNTGIAKAVEHSRVLQEVPHILIPSRIKVLNFVTPAILVEIERRQALRDEFKTALQRALDTSRQDVRRGPSVTDVALRRRHTSQRNQFLVSIATKLYTSAEECAIVEFAATALDPEVQAFFEQNVRPLVSLLQTPHQSPWHRLRFWQR